VLAAYAHALESGHAREAYDLLSEDAKKGMPFEAFERILKENPEEMRAIAGALTRPSEEASVTATAPLGVMVVGIENFSGRAEANLLRFGRGEDED